MRIPYSPQEEQVMRDMVSAGCTLEEVAQVLPHREPDALRNKAKRMGLRFTRFAEVNMEAFKRIMKQKKKGP